MARYGPPDDPNYPDNEPTAYLGPPVDEPVPWYRKPAALVAFGALGAVVVALIVYGLARLITGDSTTETRPTPLTPLTTTTAPAVAPPPETRTVTETVTPTAPTTTTTTAPTTTTTTTAEPTTETTTETTTTISTSTVTETVTVPPGG